MSDQSYSVSLRIWHPVAKCDDLLGALKLSAKIAQDVDAPRVTPKGTPLEGVYKQTYVSIPLIEKVDGSFPDGLAELRVLLEEKAAVLRNVRAGGGRVELFVGVFANDSSGYVLTSGEMALLSELGIDLAVTQYC